MQEIVKMGFCSHYSCRNKSFQKEKREKTTWPFCNYSWKQKMVFQPTRRRKL